MIVIYNPNSGGKLAEEYLHQHIIPSLETRNINYKLLRTEYEGHTQEISSRLARNGGDLVVSLLGGDSTTHEFITGLSDVDNPPKTTLVLVPTGTANALYHSMHSSSTLDKDSIEYKLLSFNSFVNKSNSAKRLALSDVIVDGGSSRKIAHVVVSTAVHAALLHRSEELRSVDTSIERFKTAFMEVCTRWTEGRLNLYASRVFSEGGFSDKVEDITLSGPFTYILASHIDRLEEKFVIAPHTTAEEGLSVVVVRPTRDPLVREHLEKNDYDAATQTSAKVLTDVMYAAYDNGNHLNLKYTNGEFVVEYYHVKSLSFEAENPGNYVCVDGNLVELKNKYAVNSSPLDIFVQI